jgi:hypothetical protein
MKFLREIVEKERQRERIRNIFVSGQTQDGEIGNKMREVD